MIFDKAVSSWPGLERFTDAKSPADAKLTEVPGQHGLGHGGDIVEGRHAVVVDPVVGSHRDAVGMSRMALVTGATTTLFKTAMASSREMTNTGLRL